jgi:hypothetical protein
VSVEQRSGYLAWQVPGVSPVVYLDHGVIDRITTDAVRGLGITRRRGTETGGILLGRFDVGETPAVWVEDIESVPCEYSQGPSYVLSPADRERFRQAAAKWTPSPAHSRYAVGLYRSHTRDGFTLHPADVSLFNEFFSDPLAITLLVKPYATRTSEAAIFVQRDGVLLLEPDPLVFRFGHDSSAEAVTPSPAAAAAPGAMASAIDPRSTSAVLNHPAAAPQLRRTAATRPPAAGPFMRSETAEEPPLFAAYQPSPSPAWKTRLAWIAFTCAAIAFGAAAGQRFLPPWLTAPSQAAPDPYAVELVVAPTSGSVMVRWNPNAPPVLAARAGRLAVSDSDTSKTVDLTAPELRTGSLIYHNVGPEVSFRLELFLSGNRTLTEQAIARIR